MEDQENNRRKIGHYEVLRTIGKGGFGTVYLCEETSSKEKFAIKEIKEKDKSKIDPKTEIEIHKRLAKKKGNRVVKITEDFEENGTVYLVMEYCKEGSLRDYIKKNGPMEVLLATDVVSQLCDALRLMHEEGIAHRDLTPSNVLIREIKRGRNDGVKRICVKVTDFGLSKETPKNARGQFRTTLGTGPFMAPEVKEGKLYTKSADVFSLGSLFYYLLTKNYLPEKQSQFELGPILSTVMAMDSVKKLEEQVQNDLKSILRGMLCSEKCRIKLEEIDAEKFMVWFYTERYEIDPELRELCSHSQSGPHGRRRYGRSPSVDSLTRQPMVQEVPKRPNKDSALGSDQQSHSSGGRCRHQQMDPESGRCRTCPFRLISSSLVTNPGTNKPSNPNPFEKLYISEPTARINRKYLVDNTNKLPPQTTSQPAAVRTAPIMPTNQVEYDNKETIYNLKQPPWPFPVITHDYSAVNEYGRCIFIKYSDSRGQSQLVTILEKTASKDDQMVRKIFELRQNESEQELQVLEPESWGIERPERNAKRIKTSNEIIERIRDSNALQKSKVAREGYATLWGFLKLLASKVVQAYCEEIVNGRKYRIELRMNGWANLYVGRKEARDTSDLKLVGRQKSEDDQLEQTKCDVVLHRDEKALVEELVRTLRNDFRESVWRKRKYDGRNIRCTIYTQGYQ